MATKLDQLYQMITAFHVRLPQTKVQAVLEQIAIDRTHLDDHGSYHLPPQVLAKLPGSEITHVDASPPSKVLDPSWYQTFVTVGTHEQLQMLQAKLHETPKNSLTYYTLMQQIMELQGEQPMASYEQKLKMVSFAAVFVDEDGGAHVLESEEIIDYGLKSSDDVSIMPNAPITIDKTLLVKMSHYKLKAYDTWSIPNAKHAAASLAGVVKSHAVLPTIGTVPKPDGAKLPAGTALYENNQIVGIVQVESVFAPGVTIPLTNGKEYKVPQGTTVKKVGNYGNVSQATPAPAEQKPAVIRAGTKLTINGIQVGTFDHETTLNLANGTINLDLDGDALQALVTAAYQLAAEQQARQSTTTDAADTWKLLEID